jgi:NAD(P)-dependent dehydrogenase (short-subunit alcohol dehydrogenase family)
MVTGATAGMGLATAQALAELGYRVVLVCRDPSRGAAAVQRIKAGGGDPAVEFLQADLSSQQQVRLVAGEFVARYARLEVLVNNAGVFLTRREESDDGLEMTFALNHLGYFLLTNLLLDTLGASAPARIVNISSDAHRQASLDWDDLQSCRKYSGFRAYSRSKLANVLFTYELARRLEGTGVTVNAVHPGSVATGFALNNPGATATMTRVVGRLFGKSPEEGAETAIYLATSPEVEGITGGYWAKKKPKESSRLSYDAGDARRLWRVSEELTGLRPG